MDHDVRFDRLEAKLDRLAEAMVKLVEIDTKIDGILFHNNTQDNRLNKHSQSIDDHIEFQYEDEDFDSFSYN
jgi:hypothetical protein